MDVEYIEVAERTVKAKNLLCSTPRQATRRMNWCRKNGWSFDESITAEQAAQAGFITAIQASPWLVKEIK